MNNRYRIEPDLDLLLSRYDGQIDRANVWQAMRRIADDPAFKPGLNVLVDLSGAKIAFDHESARWLAADIASVETMRYGRLALVAPAPVQFGISRMFGTLVEGRGLIVEYAVFADRDEARRWLGLPMDMDLQV